MTTVQALEAQLIHTTSVRERIDKLNELAWELGRQEPERCLHLLQEVHMLACTGEFSAAPYALGLAQYQTNLAQAEHFKSHYETAVAHALDAIARCEQIDHPSTLAKALEVAGLTYVRLGNHAEALPCLMRGLTIANLRGDKQSEANLYNALAILYVNLGDHQKGAVYFEQSLQLCRVMGDAYREAIMLGNLCMSYKDLGDYEKSLQYGLAGLELAARLRFSSVQMWALSNLGNLYMAQGKFEQALDCHRSAIELAESSGDAFDQAFTLLSVARTCYKQQQLDSARSYAALVLDIAQKSKQQGFQFEAHELLAAVYKAQDNFAAALAHYEQFHQIKEAIFNQEADDNLKRLEVAYRTEASRQEAEIHQLRYVELQREIGERERVQKALIQAQKLESLGVLAGGVAHDFNNLLVSILGQTALAARKLPIDHPAQRHLSKVNQAAERSANLSKQMLAYSGRGKVQVVRGNLNAMLREHSQLLHSAIGEQVQLQFELADDRLSIEVDPGQLYQVLVNLVMNAAEAGATLIRVRTKRQTLGTEDSAYWQYTAQSLPAGEYVALIVEDNGKGMDAATQEKIFDPFFSTKFTGHGLGLAAVLGIVRSHKGGIAVQSQPGQGSVLQVVLPQPLLPEAPTSTESHTPRPATSQAALHKVVVIDDQTDVRETIVAMLGQFQISTLEFVDGSSGIQYYQEHHPEIDAILLDLTMPGANGIQIWHELRAINPKALIILMSGFNTANITNHFDEAIPFLQKPFTSETMMSALHKYHSLKYQPLAI
jgi:signal transduction histidine kinase/ActR/RegA family two-component response regulator